jgi:hypothetical protein
MMAEGANMPVPPPANDADPDMIDEFGWSAGQRVRFLEALFTNSVEVSAERAGHTVASALVLRSECAEFARGWDKALERAVDLVEAQAFHRAIHGVKTMVTQNGEQVAQVRHSDSLAMFLLRAMRPGKYAAGRAHDPSPAPTMSRADIIARLRSISRNVAQQEADRRAAEAKGAGVE